jgi:hypothetical protein
MSESALNSRTSDMHTVKEKVLLYVPTTTQFTRLNLDLAVSTDQKAKRGWNDPQCASLLIAPRFQNEFFADPLYISLQLAQSKFDFGLGHLWPRLEAHKSKFVQLNFRHSFMRMLQSLTRTNLTVVF